MYVKNNNNNRHYIIILHTFLFYQKNKQMKTTKKYIGSGQGGQVSILNTVKRLLLKIKVGI